MKKDNPFEVLNRADINDSTKEKLRKMALERITYRMFKESRIGRNIVVVYLLIGVGSIFLYWRVFGLHIILSVFLGIITWFVVTIVVDISFRKIFRIDRNIKFYKSPEGIKRLKKKGCSDKEIREMQEIAEATEKDLKSEGLL